MIQTTDFFPHTSTCGCTHTHAYAEYAKCVFSFFYKAFLENQTKNIVKFSPELGNNTIVQFYVFLTSVYSFLLPFWFHRC